MHPKASLGRSLVNVSLETHRRIDARKDRAKFYALSEREHQFQYALSGTVGTLPAETIIDIKFDTSFLYEYGYRRDSQLLEPLVRFGFTVQSAPPGTVPYAHVTEWHQDADLNYTGAKVMAGVHNPLIPIIGTGQITSTDFRATLHCSFQGYGYPLDPDMGGEE